MHSYAGKLGTCTIHYNPDLSGNIIINEQDDPMGNTVTIQASDLLGFLAQMIRDKRIGELEDRLTNTSDRDILGI